MSLPFKNELKAFALIGSIALLAAPPTLAAAQTPSQETKATPAATKSGGVAEQAAPFPIATGFSHSLQKWSGLNWLTNHSLSTGASLALSARTMSLVNAHAGLKSKKVANGLRFMKLDLPGFGHQTLQVLHPQVDLQNGKVQVDTTLITAGASKDTGIPVRILATPVLENERYIKLNDMDIATKDIPNPKDFSSFLEELFNPLVDFGRMDRQTHAFRLSRLDMTGYHVSFAGRLLLAPKSELARPK